MAVLLYPAELFNEKFLIKIRDCVLKLSESHPVKQWLKHVAVPKKPDAKEQAKIDQINELIHSPFNLITDQKVKTIVINLIGEAPADTNPEILLKSYFYLLIGNITRSDNLLKSIIVKTPRENYRQVLGHTTIFHKLALQNLDKLMAKFSRHPTDRRTFELLNQYILHVFNHTELKSLAEDTSTEQLEGKLGLAYTEKIAPDFVRFLRFLKMSQNRQTKNLNSPKYDLSMQAQWIWPLVDYDQVVTPEMIDTILEVSKTDMLWANYLLTDEQIRDMFFKKSGMSAAKMRHFLRENLKNNPTDFMLTLYKLIEIGDVDSLLVEQTSKFLINE